MTDLVITYVTMNDPQWVAEYKKSLGKEPNYSRFFDWGFLKYILRGVENCLPWINKVHLVVSGRSQVPSWISEHVNIVEHKDIIPEEFLPVFNSCAIEMFLHRIPDLAEQYIYLNDDTIPINMSNESDYFEDGKVRVNVAERRISGFQNGVYNDQCIGSTRVVNDLFGVDTNTYYKPAHNFTAFLKSECEELYGRAYEQISKSISKVREGKNFNQYMYIAYMVRKGRVVESPLNLKYTSFRFPVSSIIRDIGGSANWICINDKWCNDGCRESSRKELSKAFERRFPNKCKYER